MTRKILLQGGCIIYTSQGLLTKLVESQSFEICCIDSVEISIGLVLQWGRGPFWCCLFLTRMAS